MKKILLVAGLVILVAATTSYSRSAFGSAFGTLMTARSQAQGAGALNFGVGIADATSFGGSFVYGLSKYTDGRIKIGLRDEGGNSDARFTFGADLHWQFFNVDSASSHPFDMAVGGFFEYVDLDGAKVFQIGGDVVGSYPFLLSNGSTLSPYGRFNARLESISGGGDESNLEVGLSGGVKWDVSKVIGLYGEFQIDGNDVFFFGLDFLVM